MQGQCLEEGVAPSSIPLKTCHMTLMGGASLPLTIAKRTQAKRLVVLMEVSREPGDTLSAHMYLPSSTVLTEQ